MKSLLKFTAFFVLFLTASSTYAQNATKVRENLTAAREAYDSGNYCTAIDKIKVVETEIGSTTKPATAYIKIMSYYKLKEYQNCIDAANAYLADKPAQDETLEEIRKVHGESQKMLATAQTAKDETIAWLTTTLQKHFLFQKNLRVVVEPCQITIYYTRVLNGQNIRRKEVYPTKFSRIYKMRANDDYYSIEYSGKNVSETNLDTGKIIYYASSKFLSEYYISPAMAQEIAGKILYLNTLCGK
jgi:hypothetical protein